MKVAFFHQHKGFDKRSHFNITECYYRIPKWRRLQESMAGIL